jgi:hypothetical protein
MCVCLNTIHLYLCLCKTSSTFKFNSTWHHSFSLSRAPKILGRTLIQLHSPFIQSKSLFRFCIYNRGNYGGCNGSNIVSVGHFFCNYANWVASFISNNPLAIDLTEWHKLMNHEILVLFSAKLILHDYVSYCKSWSGMLFAGGC